MNSYKNKEWRTNHQLIGRLLALSLCALILTACSSRQPFSIGPTYSVLHFLTIQNKTNQQMRNIEVVYDQLKFDRPLIAVGGSLVHGYEVPVAQSIQISWASESGDRKTVELPVRERVTNWRELKGLKFIFSESKTQIVESYVDGDPKLYKFSEKIIYEVQH